MTKRILVVDDEPNFRHMLTKLLGREGYQVESADGGRDALERYALRPADLVITDLRMPEMDGLELLAAMREGGSDATVIVMTAYGSFDTALEAMKAGAYDYISKPFKPEEIILTLRKAEERERLRRENQGLRKQIRRAYGVEGVIHGSAAMREVLETVEKVAPYKSTVLITGESGTGKEVIARAVHHSSPRDSRPFIAVNCGAIPAPLLESELFGHVKGAFTDAVRDRRGLFEEADGSTLFLDEIGELPSELQVKLLRALQEEEVRRVGDTKPITVDVRIIAATSRNLQEDVGTGRFREDLYYRLNVMQLHLAPLRERVDDIGPLVEFFLSKANGRLGTTVAGLSPAAMELLVRYPWPGNVRELENAIERALVLCESDTIEPGDLPERVRHAAGAPEAALDGDDLSLKRAVRSIEESYIRRALERTEGNRTRAAEMLEISARALLYKLKEYQIR